MCTCNRALSSISQFADPVISSSVVTLFSLGCLGYFNSVFAGENYAYVFIKGPDRVRPFVALLGAHSGLPALRPPC